MGKEKKRVQALGGVIRAILVTVNIQGALTTLCTVVCMLYASSANPHDKPIIIPLLIDDETGLRVREFA